MNFSQLVRTGFATFCMIGLITIWIGMPPLHLYADENVHVLQAWLYAHGQFQTLPVLSTWPTLNWLVGGVLGWWQWPLSENAAARTVAFAFAALACWGYWEAQLSILGDQPAPSSLRTAQFFSLPLVFPFCVLVYTDIPALCGLIWAVVGIRQKNTILFAASMALAIAFRQSNVYWLLVGYAYFLLQFEAPRWQKTQVQRLTLVTVLLGSAWLCVVLLSGGVAFSSQTHEHHHLGVRGLPNLYFFFFCWAVIYAPLMAEKLPEIAHAEKRWRWIFASLALSLLIVLTFKVDHPSNVHVIPIFIRNLLLAIFSTGWALWGFSAIAATAGICLFNTKLTSSTRVHRVWFVSAGALSILPFWLIEQRYYLPFLMVFNLFRATCSKRTELALLSWNIACTGVLMYLILTGRYFL